MAGEIRAAFYARVSSDEQRERQSIESQTDFAARWFELYSIAPVVYYRDDGVRGSVPLDERPAGAQLLLDLAAGRINAVYVFRVDRLARDLRLLLAAIHRMEAHGGKLVSLTESFDTSSPSGRAMLGMLGVFAQYERDSIAERCAAGRLRTAREGRWGGGWRPPYGYTVEEGYLAPADMPLPGLVLSEADVVRLVYRMLVVERFSTVRIAEQLNALAVPTAYGDREFRHAKSGKAPSGLWSAARVRQLIITPAYGGRAVWGTRAKRAEVVERPCAALVDAETWEQAQQQLQANRHQPRSGTVREYLLRGLLQCGLCGRRYVGWPVNGRVYYACSARISPPAGGSRCESALVAARHETDIQEMAERALTDPGYRAALAAEPTPPPPADLSGDLSLMDAALAAVAAKRQKAHARWARDLMSDADLDLLLEQLRLEEQEWRRQRGVLMERAAVSPAPAPSGPEFWDELLRRWRAASTTEEYREILALLIVAARVDTTREGKKRLADIHITWQV